MSQVQLVPPHNRNVREVNSKCTCCRVVPELDETFPFPSFQNIPPLHSAWYQLQEALQWSSLLSLVIIFIVTIYGHKKFSDMQARDDTTYQSFIEHSVLAGQTVWRCPTLLHL